MGVAVSYPANLGCGQSAGGYTMVCPGTVGASATAKVTPPSAVSSFTAWTFDAAGNTHGGPASVDFFAMDSTAVRSGHQWRTDAGPPDTNTCSKATVPDSASPAMPLTLSGGVCWAKSTVLPVKGQVGVLSFAGTDGVGTASGASVDTTGSFSVAAWVNPTAGGRYQTAVSQDGVTRSAFYLQATPANQWRFCVVPDQAGGAVCAVSAKPVVYNQWTFVAGSMTG